MTIGECGICGAPLSPIPREDGLSIHGNPNGTPHYCWLMDEYWDALEPELPEGFVA